VMGEPLVTSKRPRGAARHRPESTWRRAITRRAWRLPLTMFLTPDGEPFWGGTYFPNNLALRQSPPSSTSCARSRRLPQERRASSRTAGALMATLSEAGAAAGQGGDRAPELDRAANKIAGQ